jgi:hypothetical protein
MSVVLDLEQRHQARLEFTDGHFVKLVSTKPFPPGATLCGQLQGESAPYLVKVRGCCRVSGAEPHATTDAVAAEFIVEGRWVNLSRRQREKLGVAAGSGTRTP